MGGRAHCHLLPNIIFIPINIGFRAASWAVMVIKLLMKTMVHIMIILHRYFGLQYQDSKGYIAWLKLDKKVTYETKKIDT